MSENEIKQNEIENSSYKGENKKKNNWLIVLIPILVMALVAGFYFYQQSINSEMEPNAVIGVMPGKSEEQIKAELDQKVKEKEIAFAINAYPVVESGKDKFNILFENPKSNNKLTKIQITIDETSEVIYKSGYVSPGSYIPDAKLLKDLEPGRYECTAIIEGFRSEDKTSVGKVAAGVSLMIE